MTNSTKKELGTKNEKKLDTKIEEDILISSEESTAPSAGGYTTSPDGKYKIQISEYDSDRFEENKFNIPQIKIPGWVVTWPHDVKANTIPHMVDQGWLFVSPKENEAAARKIPAGRTQGGETAFHYAMKMPEGKFKEMRAREEKQRQSLLDSIKRAPSDETNAIYATDEMK